MPVGSSATRAVFRRPRCVICGTPLGSGSRFVEDEDYRMLMETGLPREVERCTVPRACKHCRPTVDGLAAHVLSLAVLVAAGLLCFAGRVYRATSWEENTSWQQLNQYLTSPDFASTKHGMPDYRLDRMTLFILGPLKSTCEAKGGSSWRTKLVFGLVLARVLINDAEVCGNFFPVWLLAQGTLPCCHSFNAALALKLVSKLWVSEKHSTGFGVRLFPQRREGNKGRLIELGATASPRTSHRPLRRTKRQ